MARQSLLRPRIRPRPSARDVFESCKRPRRIGRDYWREKMCFVGGPVYPTLPDLQCKIIPGFHYRSPLSECSHRDSRKPQWPNCPESTPRSRPSPHTHTCSFKAELPGRISKTLATPARYWCKRERLRDSTTVLVTEVSKSRCKWRGRGGGRTRRTTTLTENTGSATARATVHQRRCARLQGPCALACIGIPTLDLNRWGTAASAGPRATSRVCVCLSGMLADISTSTPDPAVPPGVQYSPSTCNPCWVGIFLAAVVGKSWGWSRGARWGSLAHLYYHHHPELPFRYHHCWLCETKASTGVPVRHFSECVPRFRRTWIAFDGVGNYLVRASAAGCRLFERRPRLAYPRIAILDAARAHITSLPYCPFAAGVAWIFAPSYPAPVSVTSFLGSLSVRTARRCAV